MIEVIMEVVAMWHYPEIVEKFPTLDKREQDAFLCGLNDAIDHGTPNGLLIACVRGRSWLLLKRSLEVQKIRNSLWSVIDDLESFSSKDGTTKQLFQSLPSRLTPEEGRLAMVYPSLIKSWPLAEQAMEKGALPGRETFLRAFDAYLSKEKTLYEYKLISKAMNDPAFQWQSLLSLPSHADSTDLLKRAQTSSKMAYYTMAFALMSDDQKGHYLNKLTTMEDLDKARHHMAMPDKWMEYLSMNMKAKLITELMGL